MAAKHTASVDNLLNSSTSSSAETVCVGNPSASEGSSKLGPGLWLKMNWKRALEILVLSGVILLVCGLFTIPTILYALPPLQTNEEASINTSHLCTDNLAMGNAADITLCQNTSVQQSDDEITCVMGFYLDNSTRPVCIPHCKSWLNISTSDIVITVCLSLSIITCIVLFIIVRFQRHTMFVFPTFYLVYVSIATFFGAPFLIIGNLLKGEVFCSSDSFIESMINSSPFCTISGIVNSYVVAQVTLLVTFHALGLCWGVAFPFHYRRFKVLGRIKYIHAFSVLLGLVLPAIPALLHLIYGYSFAIGPINACIVRDIGFSYFTLVLPTSILMAMATSSLVILFWKLFTEFILKRFNLQSSNGQITKAEIKIFVIMCYYVIMGTFTLSTYTYSLATDDDFVNVLQLYFACQGLGIQPGKDCGEPPDIQLQGFSVAATVSFALQGLLPLVAIVFTFIVNCSCCTCSKKHSKTISKSKSHATSEQCI